MQQIDSATKTVSAEVVFDDLVYEGAVVGYDETIDALIVGYNVPGNSWADPPVGYRVAAVLF